MVDTEINTLTELIEILNSLARRISSEKIMIMNKINSKFASFFLRKNENEEKKTK